MMLKPFAALFLLLTSPALAQSGVERIWLDTFVQHAVVVGSTTWISVITRPSTGLIRVDGGTATPVTLTPPVGITNDLASTPGFLWLLTPTSLVRLEIAGGTTTVLQSMTFSAFDRIVAGSDGNLWFSRGTQVFRMTPSGAIVSQFQLPFSVTELAATPNAVWAVGGPYQFLGAGPTAVRLGIDGSLQTFALPAAVGAAAPGLGSDVWLGGANGGRLLHLDDSGTMLEAFLVPPHQFIAVAPQGEVWLAGFEGPIHRIHNGVRTTYPILVERTCPSKQWTAIVIGADGRPRILENLSPGIGVPCNVFSTLPFGRQALVVLDPAQLPGGVSVPLEALAAIPAVSPMGLVVLALALSCGAMVVMRR